jgi:hypothetical protein
MLKRGAQVNQKGWTALHYAAAGSVEIGTILLDKYAYIDAEAPSGMTPLMLAAREGQEEVVACVAGTGRRCHAEGRRLPPDRRGIRAQGRQAVDRQTINSFLAARKQH